MKRGFSVTRMARYISMNCESEAMLLNKEETKEAFFVEQTKEYLRGHFSIVDPEVSLLSSSQKTDIAFKRDVTKPYTGIIEAKFIAKWRPTFIEEIYEDILRSVSINDQVFKKTARLILVGGFRPVLEKLFTGHGSHEWHKGDKPEFPFLFPFRGDRPIKTGWKKIMLNEFPHSLRDEMSRVKKNVFKDDQKRADKMIGYKASLVASYFPSDKDFSEDEKEDIVDVYIWVVQPL